MFNEFLQKESFLSRYVVDFIFVGFFICEFLGYNLCKIIKRIKPNEYSY